MANLSELEENLIKKVIKKFKQDDKLRNECLGSAGLTTLGLANAAGNHCFDDYPETFDITENEGHIIRAYFQINHHIEEIDCRIKSLIDSEE